jgi:diguanylate cyclase (GGDEF)-like protein
MLVSAEILLWQARFRRAFVALVGVGMVALKWSGVISAQSVISAQVGAHRALEYSALLTLLYLVWIQCQMVWLRRRGTRSVDTAVIVNVVADMVLLFGVTFLTTPPHDYQRALIVSVFTVQMTQLYFGVRATFYNLACVGLFYTLIVLLASSTGAIASPAEQFWDLSLYLAGTLTFVTLQSAMTTRLERIVQVFERAQEGDFTQEYDDSLDRIPDSITVVGRAYNRMRGKLEAIVLTDSLSGCFNRRGFDSMATRELSRAVRGGHVMAVLALDVDHFKSVNDDFGHLTGDEVLREIGELLRETARLGDVVARIGGEEFSILAPDTNREGAIILAERVHQAFRARTFRSLRGERKITISIGVAADQARSDEVLATLRARADEALYVAKKNGRDRTESWHPGMRAFDPAGRRSNETPAVVVE